MKFMTPYSSWELPVQSPLRSLKPLSTPCLSTTIVTNYLLCIPIKNYNYIHPPTLRYHLRHVHSPPLVRANRLRFTPLRYPLCPYSLIRPHCQVMLLHKPVYTLLVYRQPPHITQICPYTTVSPERVIPFYLPYSLNQGPITHSNRVRWLPHMNSSSLFFNSTVNAPIICLSSAFSLRNLSTSPPLFLASNTLCASLKN